MKPRQAYLLSTVLAFSLTRCTRASASHGGPQTEESDGHFRIFGFGARSKSSAAIFDWDDQTGRQGGWNAQYYSLIEQEAARFPLLFGGGANPLGRLCPNFSTFGYDDQRKIWARVLAAHAFAESSYDPSVNGGESVQKERAVGLWQISPNSRGFGCEWSPNDSTALSQIKTDVAKNIRCVFRFYTHRIQRGKPIYGEVKDLRTPAGEPDDGLHWSVLQVGNKFESKFVPLFKRFVPECQSLISGTRNKVNGLDVNRLQNLPATNIPLTPQLAPKVDPKAITT